MNLRVKAYACEDVEPVGTGSESFPVKAWSAVAFQAGLLRRTIGAESGSEPCIDILDLEERARAARNAWIGSGLRCVYGSLMSMLGRNGSGTDAGVVRVLRGAINAGQI